MADDPLPDRTLTQAFAAPVAPLIPPGAPSPDPVRYGARSLLGQGGMGQVWRVHDARLGRDVALKVLRPELAHHPGARRRFRDEATITAGLDHPGVVAVYDTGTLDDGRPWYTLREIRGGRTLGAAIRGGEIGWTRGDLRELVGGLLAVSNALAFAHEHGVIHRDVKPNNVLLGRFGEVLLLDWGLARRGAEGAAGLEAAVFGVAAEGTRAGAALGTPPYFPPEQAFGHVEAHGPWSDVYALGAVLYEILAGRPPYEGDAAAIARRLAAGPPDPLDVVAAGAPAELRALATECLAHAPEARPEHAGVVAERLRAWLDGAARTARASAMVDRADALQPEIAALRAEAARVRVEVARLEAALPAYPAPEERYPVWALEEDAARLDREVTLAEVRYEQGVRAALEHAPEHAGAHARLADLYRSWLVQAEARRDMDSALRWEGMLRGHDRGRHAAWLTGRGRLTLRTEPPGAEVALYRFTPVHRRLEPRFERRCGATPVDLDLEPGSWLVRLEHPACHPVSYPVAVARGEHWDAGDAPIALPPLGDLGPDDCYVPAGWFRAGGDPLAPDSLPAARVWVDGFVLRRFPVTNAEYLAFLNALVEAGRGSEAEGFAPGNVLSQDASGVMKGPDGRFHLDADASGRAWHPQWPVTLVDWWGATAYAAWESARTGRAWRLPHELEWEKAARGVDGRFLPWGDHLEPGWANIGEGRATPPEQRPVGEFPEDSALYGVRGLCGGVRDWCLNSYVRSSDGVVLAVPDGSALRTVRGGHWAAAAPFCRAAGRVAAHPPRRLASLGFRLARSYPFTAG